MADGLALRATGGPAMRARLVALTLAMAVSLWPSAAAGASGSQGPTDSVRLSDERTSTSWAHPVEIAPIHAMPAPSAQRITRTRLQTEDGFPEVYLVLASWSDPSGQGWLEVRIPMRPNGEIGWVREDALGPLYHVDTQLVVDRSKRRATLYRDGRKVWSAPVGIGKSSTPTPTGHFWIREKFKVSDSGGLYGPVSFGTSDYSVLTDWPGGGVIGIHGTDEPALIPGRPSHGCIRVKNHAVRQLFRLMPIGTPLLIRQ